MVNRRKLERFDLQLQTLVSAYRKGCAPDTMNLLTTNISSSGAFLRSGQFLPIGTKVRLDLVLPLDELKKDKVKKTLIEVSGEVIRNERQGMAVCFAEDYKISPIVGTTTED
jgi:PilZ domain